MINLATDPELTGRITAADADNPYGSIKNETAPGANDGTQLIKRRSDNIFAFMYAAMLAAGIVPDGDVETATSSQVLTALHTLYRGSVAVNLNNMQKIAAALNNDPNYNTTIRTYIDGQITTLTNLLRGTVQANLNTLQELAAAINNDSDFHGTIDQRFTDLIDGAPGTLDTLNKLAAAINDDADFHNTIGDYVDTAIDGVNANLNVSLPSIANMTGNVGKAVNIILPQAGGAYYPFAYNFSNLPDGLTNELNRIMGRPTNQQDYSVTIQVTDNLNNNASRIFSWDIGARLTQDTIWFIDDSNDMAVAYTASTRARNASRDISLGSGLWHSGISDGTTLWFVQEDGTVHAYTASTRARDSAKDIDLGSGTWRGGNSDQDTLWFIKGDQSASMAEAYTASTRARDSAKDIDLGSGTWNGGAYDGTDLWFVQRELSPLNSYLRAYVASTLARDSAKDILIGTNNLSAYEFAVSDFTTIWAGLGTDASAYVAATRARDTAKDISLGNGNWHGAVFA